MGNFSQSPEVALKDAVDKGYDRVLFQQGKPVLDRELNLLADLASPERLAASYLGNGIPTGSDGFRVSALDVAAGDFAISPGRALVDGHEVSLTAATTLRTQPNNLSIGPLPGGKSRVYLRVFLSEVGAGDDPTLAPPDVGMEASVRRRVGWQVIVSAAPITTHDHLPLAEIDADAVSVSDLRRRNLELAEACNRVDQVTAQTATLASRVGVSLLPAGGLRPAVVGPAELRASAESAKRAVTGSHIQDGEVGVDHLAAKVVVEGEFSVNGGTAASPGVQIVTLEDISDSSPHRYYLVSVMTKMRASSPIGPPVSVIVAWRLRSRASAVFPLPATQVQELVLENSAATSATVRVKVLRFPAP